MGTRGLYGLRKDGVDKTTYNHFDSYPDGLGREIVRFCVGTTNEKMNEMFDAIEMVREKWKASASQISFCVDNGLYDGTVSTGEKTDWYCLLRNAQGDLGALKRLVEQTGKAYMIDNHTFILDSVFCEYAYIVDLDTNMLEFYVGFSKEPQSGNRYGYSQNKEGYYPCRLAAAIPLSTVRIIGEDGVVEILKKAENTAEGVVLTNDEYHALMKIAGASKMDCWFWIESENGVDRVRDLENDCYLDFAYALAQLVDGMVEPADDAFYALTSEEVEAFDGLVRMYPPTTDEEE